MHIFLNTLKNLYQCFLDFEFLECLVLSTKIFEQFHDLILIIDIDIFLNNFIGKRGNLTSINDYWSIATYFEMNVLTKNYSKAMKAAECMFKLKPLIWQVINCRL